MASATASATATARAPSRAPTPPPRRPGSVLRPPTEATLRPKVEGPAPDGPASKGGAAASKELIPSHVPMLLGPPQPEASLRAQALAHLRGLGLVVCGIGVVVGFSYALAACGATAGLLQVLSGASVLDRVAGSVPFIGPLLAVLMGVGGNYGFANVGLIVFYVVDACFAQRDKTGTIIAWLCAHAAMAGALSPLWLAGATPITAPVLLGVAAGVGYLSWTIQRAEAQATPPNFNHALFSLGVSLALAPIGAQAAAGIASIRIARQAVNFPLLAFGCIAIVSALRQLWTLFGSGSSGALGGTQLRSEGVIVFDGHNAGEATAFYPQDVVDAVQDLVVRVRSDVAHNKNDGPRCYLLRAPRGAGKHTLACGVANALQTRIYQLERSAFEALGKGHSGRALAQQMQQWGEQAEELGRPLVIFVPELIQLAPRAVEDDFVSQLKTLLANEGGGTARNLLFLLGTSEPATTVRARIDPAILNRITRTWRWRTLSAEDLPRLLEVKLRTHLVASSIHRELVGPIVARGLRASSEAALAGGRLQGFLRRGCTGSHVEALAVEAVDDTVSSYLRRRRPELGPYEPSLEFPLAERVERELLAAVDARLADRTLGDDDDGDDVQAGSRALREAPPAANAAEAPTSPSGSPTGLGAAAPRSTPRAEVAAPLTTSPGAWNG